MHLQQLNLRWGSGTNAPSRLPSTCCSWCTSKSGSHRERSFRRQLTCSHLMLSRASAQQNSPPGCRGRIRQAHTSWHVFGGSPIAWHFEPSAAVTFRHAILQAEPVWYHMLSSGAGGGHQGKCTHTLVAQCWLSNPPPVYPLN